MRYYKFVVNSITVGVSEYEGILNMEGAKEITKDQYISLGGTLSNPSVTVEELQQENKLLKAQIQAQTERSDFIEDCIAEMATQVYGGV